MAGEVEISLILPTYTFWQMIPYPGGMVRERQSGISRAEGLKIPILANCSPLHISGPAFALQVKHGIGNPTFPVSLHISFPVSSSPPLSSFIISAVAIDILGTIQK